ncbi:TetR family transcriptional regulator [Actinomadura pelletieri DSM 43383]|uniref:TetR family transcriptional regulator n=1 Tax=Actinomadura pelletieri DSM 43383 TaxID=1120940 RepID=A0A495QXD4_9ACTN|nr:TetR/AcrR family transcriptional regulator C-terminal domain-containing protein [Actinomadura pelletieri]RKS78778.1 TetR family transcriptional regulator [Actinomadura pelletieri DSM 43383]
MARPRKPLLDHDRIATATLELVDEEGNFTMPGLARRLGVQTPSLYHHVDGRAGVIELLRGKIDEQIDNTLLDLTPWDRALDAYARAHRAAFAAHPHVIPLLATSTVHAPRVVAVYDKIAELLSQAGVPPEQIMPSFTALENFLLGSALDLAAPEVMWEVPPDVQAPHLSQALTAQAASATRSDQAFEFGLAAMLDALRHMND